MSYSIESEIRTYKPAIMLENMLPRTLRRFMQAILFVITVALGTFLVFHIVTSSPSLLEPSIDVLTNGQALFSGIFLISLSLFLFVTLLSSFFNARFYRGIDSIVNEGVISKKRGLSYEAAHIFMGMRGDDIVPAFLNSKYGREILVRCNLYVEDIKVFLDNRTEKVSKVTLDLPDTGFLTIENIAEHVFKQDESFKKFLFDRGVTVEVYNSSTAWVMQTHHHRKYDTRWWGRDNLGRVATLGSEWSYGGAYLLEQYAKNIGTVAVFSILTGDVAYAREKIEHIESILARAKEANVMLVGDRGVGKMDIIVQLMQRMKSGKAVPSIVNKRIVVFDAESFMVSHNSKQLFEEGIVKLFHQAVKAGNIIMVIDNFPSFLASAEALDSNVFSLIDKYVMTPELQVIATSDPVRYHNEIESKPQVIQRFERVQIESPELASTIRVVESIALRYERRYNILFTYLAIQAIVNSADRYITDGVMPDKAVELLTEIAPYANEAKVTRVTRDFVHTYIGKKTGIKVGPIQEQERDKLLHLEGELHKRVIGQDNAVKAISGVMRRSRAGIQDENRPLGSFLFLGSTGVGKTETAKALAAVFFGNEDHMSRLDMSEFSGGDSLDRLIGRDGKTGILSDLLKERPYGVLLIDEFEKASTAIHDLFLQILDEGFFSDSNGSRVSARNSIIIATSNAGSSMIWDLIKEGSSPTAEREKIISSIIHEGVYKPELINRFDGTIIFEPLTVDEQKEIAILLLRSLKSRLHDRGYDFVVNSVVTDLLIREGYSPEFGARPMRRVVQDKIEDKIAERIIEGNLTRGDKIEFAEGDFAA